MTTASVSEKFYNEVSEFYDDMIDFKASLQKRKELLSIILKGKTGNAADLGCGSGLDSIALTSLGFQVTGFDISDKMLSKANQNASSEKYKIDFVKSSIDKISSTYFGKYDIVLSFGNTLPNLDMKKAEKTTGKIFHLLKPGGMALIQILNYSKIISLKERIINIKVKDERVFIRFYDFLETLLNFNILSFPLQNPADKQFLTSTIFPYTKKELKQFLTNAGFNKFEFYGNLKLEAFDPKTSADLIIMTHK